MEGLDDMHNSNGKASAKICHENVVQEGNTGKSNAFGDGKLYETILNYSKNLENDPDDAETLSNRASCLLRARLYDEARKDLTKVMKLEKGTRNMMTIQLLCKTFWNQKEFKEAINLLQDIQKTLLTGEENVTISQMIETSKTLSCQSQTGLYNMPELILKKEQTYECAEYVGPVTIATIPGKGRGLIATEDIQRGQVVIGSKAFAIVFPGQHKHRSTDEVLPNWKKNDYGEQYKEDPKHEELVKTVMSLLKANPSLKKEVFNLYAGPKFECSTGQKEGVQNEENVLDLGRANSICYYNAFFSATNPDPKQDPDPNEIDEIRNVNTYGLWLLPSYLNHTCVDINCDVQKYGDFMIIRALSHINKGQELLISYIYPTKSFKERNADLQGYGFTCVCRLCQIEQNESAQIHQKRVDLMNTFLETCANNPVENLTLLKSVKSQLEALRPSSPQLNWTLFWVNQQIGKLLAANFLDYEAAAEYFEASYRLSENTSMHREGIRFALQALLCYVYSHKKCKAKQWAGILKDAIITAYGTLDVLPAVAARDKIMPSVLMKILKENIENLTLSWTNQ